MPQKNPEGQDLNESLVTSGKTSRIAVGRGADRNTGRPQLREKGKGKMAGGRIRGTSAALEMAGSAYLGSLFAGKRLGCIGS